MSTVSDTGPSGGAGLRGTLLLVVDAALAGIVFVAPLLMGARHPLGQLLLVALIGVLSVAWLARQALSERGRWKHVSAQWLWLGVAALVALQLVPLPPQLLSSIAPGLTDVSSPEPLAAHLGQGDAAWWSASLDPSATRTGLTFVAAYGLLFLVVVQRLRELADVRRLMTWIGLSSVAMAGVGLAQYAFGNGHFLWIYAHPQRAANDVVMGTFSNPNHFAHFLALGLGPLVAWGLAQWQAATKCDPQAPRALTAGAPGDSWRLWLAVAALVIPAVLLLVAGALSLSRGGIVALLVAAVLALVAGWRAGYLDFRSCVAVFLSGLVATIALSAWGGSRVQQELDSLASGSLEQLDPQHARLTLWGADLQAAARFPVLGTGVGTHAAVYPVYYPKPAMVEYTHAENGYVQIALETGAPGVLLTLCALALLAAWCWRVATQAQDPEVLLWGGAAVAGIAVSVLQSAWDFVWYTPACLVPALLLAACLGELCRYTRGESPVGSSWSELSRVAWGLAALLATGLGCYLAADRLGPALAAPAWDRYLASSLASNRDLIDSNRADRAPASLSPELVRKQLQCLEDVVRFDPGNHRAELRLAALYVRWFELRQQAAENSLTLAQIRDAGRSAGFQSPAQRQQWLARVLGDNRRWLERAARHARRGLSLCPLAGEGYLVLSEVLFLERDDPVRDERLLAQALRVRPHNGNVLLAIGQEAALAGDTARALEFWRRAFHAGPEHRQRLVSTLAPQVGANVFLEHFEPDEPALWLLFERYRALGLDGDARTLAEALARGAAAERDAAPTAHRWLRLSGVHRFLGDRAQAVAAARRAVELSPHAFDAHRHLALVLLEADQWDEAAMALKWCLYRRPGDDELRRWLRVAQRKNVEVATRPDDESEPSPNPQR